MGRERFVLWFELRCKNSVVWVGTGKLDGLNWEKIILGFGLGMESYVVGREKESFVVCTECNILRCIKMRD